MKINCLAVNILQDEICDPAGWSILLAMPIVSLDEGLAVH